MTKSAVTATRAVVTTVRHTSNIVVLFWTKSVSKAPSTIPPSTKPNISSMGNYHAASDPLINGASALVKVPGAPQKAASYDHPAVTIGGEVQLHRGLARTRVRVYARDHAG